MTPENLHTHTDFEPVGGVFETPEGYEPVEPDFEPILVTRQRRQASRLVLWLMLMACGCLVAIFAAIAGALWRDVFIEQWSLMYYGAIEFVLQIMEVMR